MNSVMLAASLMFLSAVPNYNNASYELTATNFNKNIVYSYKIQYVLENNTHKIFKTHKNVCLLKQNKYKSTKEKLIFKNFTYENIQDYLKFTLSDDQWCYITLSKDIFAPKDPHKSRPKTKNIVANILIHTFLNNNKSHRSFYSAPRHHNLKNRKRYNNKNKKRLIKRVYY